MSRFRVEHQNVIVHFENEKSVIDYVKRLGKTKVTVYESKVVFDRTANSIKIDRL